MPNIVTVIDKPAGEIWTQEEYNKLVRAGLDLELCSDKLNRIVVSNGRYLQPTIEEILGHSNSTVTYAGHDRRWE